MQEQIINFFVSISIKDYIIFIISICFFILFIFIWWIDKIYKAYLWIILWLFIFTIINLTLKSLNDNDIWISSFRDFFINHKEWFWFYSILSIPILAILVPLNQSIEFRISKKKALNYITTFLFWILFFYFLLTIFLSIINNRFLFSIDNSVLSQIKENYIIKSIYDYFIQSVIFNYLIKYDYIINTIIIWFIFYKMTIWWIIDSMISKLFRLFVNFFKNKEKWGKNEHSWNNEHEHWDTHWHNNH